MLGNLLLVVVIIALAAGLALLARAAWRRRTLPMRILAFLPLGFVAALLLLASVVLGRGMALSYLPRQSPVPNVQADATPERLARGQMLATALCAACHGTQGALPLSGGFNLADDIPLPIGALYTANLTPAGDLPNWSDGEILRAMREGIDRAGKPLAGMPAGNLRNLSDGDALSIVAFLRSQPASGAPAPASRIAPLGLLMVGAGMFPVGAPPVTQAVVAPPSGPTAAYGDYIVSFSDCRDCHGPDLRGGKGPGPIGPNLRVVQSYTTDDFIRMFRTGVNPGGHQLQPPMPWKQIGALGDVELTALHEYLRGLQ